MSRTSRQERACRRNYAMFLAAGAAYAVSKAGDEAAAIGGDGSDEVVDASNAAFDAVQRLQKRLEAWRPNR